METVGRVLLVEDHVDTAASLAWFLAKWGYDVRVEHTGAAALAAAGEKPFDIVATDLGLPDMTGEAMMRELHEKYGLIGIALSGYEKEGDAGAAAAGLVAHLTKPVQIAELRAVLERVLRRRPLQS